MERADVTAVAEPPPQDPERLPGPRFHALTVTEIVHETPDAISIAFDVPAEVRGSFAYRAGQFVTLRVLVQGEPEFRSYSMCSSPDVDADFRVTVKRVPDGAVSNWLNDHLGVGDALDVSEPMGNFVLPDNASDSAIVAFAGGSGITPIFSIIKSALARSDRRVRLLYANRDRSSVIFRQELEALEARYPGRVEVEHSFDEDDGFIDGATVGRFLGTGLEAEFFVCGPTGFMNLVTTTLVWCGARSDQLHVEWFTPGDEEAHSGIAGGAARVTVTLGDRTATVDHRGEWTLLQAARAAGLKVASSCHLGLCGTCIGRLTGGRAEMRNNEVLSADEVAEGWILTCQARPLTDHVEVVYEDLP